MEDKIITACERLGYPLDKSGRPNIVYIEGVDTKGDRRKRVIDNFCDLRVTLAFLGDKWHVLTACDCTTMPGKKAMIDAHVNNLPGAAVVCDGYHQNAWVLGWHKADKYGHQHPALRQAMAVSYSREMNDNWVRDDSFKAVGVRNLNQHGANKDKITFKINSWSAGCLVASEWIKHLKFIYTLAYWEAYGWYQAEAHPFLAQPTLDDVNALVEISISKKRRVYWPTTIISEKNYWDA